MAFLADTQAVIWFLSGSDKLSVAARAIFDRADAALHVSAATAWEISTKHRLGKLPDITPGLAANVERFVRRYGFQPLPVSMAHAEMAGRFEDPHKDPFDRMLIAQALAEDLVLNSDETVLDRFGVRRLW